MDFDFGGCGYMVMLRFVPQATHPAATDKPQPRHDGGLKLIKTMLLQIQLMMSYPPFHLKKRNKNESINFLSRHP